jgi:aminopeptidase N
MVAFYAELVAPFPYEKLAHVQSSTRYGGMENVTAIFYDERALAARRDIEGTVAHEVAHQWFGDAVTEADWQHLWLSEGFATYLDAVFYEREDGVDVFRRKMAANAAAYLGSNVTDLPLVDTTASLLPDLFALLNQNSYQKGAWVLHMLRGRLGDDAFFAGIRDYYATHEHGTALSADLQAALERASGTDLDAFFDQWVYGPGHPILRASHEYRDGRLRITIEQTQKTTWPTFTGPVMVEIVTPSGTLRETVQLTGRTSTAERPLDAAPTALHLDPDGWLLHEVAP